MNNEYNKIYKDVKKIAHLPLIIQKNIIKGFSKKLDPELGFEKYLHSKLPIIFTKLYEGDLENYINKLNITEKELFNYIAQIYLTIFFIIKEIEKIDIKI